MLTLVAFGLVVAGSRTATGQTLTVSPTSVAAGGTVTATWTGIVSPTTTDWIGLYTSGASDTTYLAWRYTTGTASGNVPFTIPGTIAPGTYQLRLFRNDGFTRLATSGPLTVTGGPDPRSVVGEWSSVLIWPYTAIHLHMLPTGKVAFWGSYETDAPELWDPATGAFTTTGPTGYNIFCTGHSFLADGRLLVTGGHVNTYIGEPFASIFDPFTNVWTNVLDDMNAGRWYPTNVTLANGDVLVVAGQIDTAPEVMNPLPQVWQAASETWRSLTNAELVLPLYPYMYVAPNGRVFNAGPNQIARYLDTSGSGTWTVVANNRVGTLEQGSSVMYDPGKVLIVGGGLQEAPSNTAQVIDLTIASPAWRSVTPMASARRHHNATLLADGTVFVTGGSNSTNPDLWDDQTGAVYAAEMWNPQTEAWSTMASLTVYRGYHATALLLPDGRVLSAGGDVGGPTAEVYSPPYLFRGTRPTITDAPTSVGYNQTVLVRTLDATSITQVTWIRLSSVTHGFNQDQRLNRLSFAQTAGGLNVTTPAGPTLAPPGYYMLFILNSSGVPSEARIIRIG
jgi:hypothetical protein